MALDGPDSCSVFGQRKSLLVVVADHFLNKFEVEISSYGRSAVNQRLEAKPTLTVELGADRAGLVPEDIAEEFARISEFVAGHLDPF